MTAHYLRGEDCTNSYSIVRRNPASSAADYIRRELNALSEEDFQHFLTYHLATCERPELLGASSHTVDVLRKP